MQPKPGGDMHIHPITRWCLWLHMQLAQCPRNQTRVPEDPTCRCLGSHIRVPEDPDPGTRGTHDTHAVCRATRFTAVSVLHATPRLIRSAERAASRSRRTSPTKQCTVRLTLTNPSRRFTLTLSLATTTTTTICTMRLISNCHHA